MQLKVHVDVSVLERRFERNPKRAAVVARDALREEMAGFRETVIKKHTRAGGRRAIPGRLTLRTGWFKRSFRVGASGSTFDTIRGWAGFSTTTEVMRTRNVRVHPAAAAILQEFGGIVKPQRGKYLAIPFGPARDSRGLPRYGSPREAGKLIAKKSRRNPENIILYRRAGRELIAMFVLVKETNHAAPGRLRLRAGLDKMRERIVKRVDAALARNI